MVPAWTVVLREAMWDGLSGNINEPLYEWLVGHTIVIHFVSVGIWQFIHKVFCVFLKFQRGVGRVSVVVTVQLVFVISEGCCWENSAPWWTGNQYVL